MTVAGGFIEAAQKAVRDWLFLPALDASKPISSEMDVHIIFSPDNPYFRGPASDFPPEEQWPYRPPVTEAKLISEPDIDYPDSLFDRRLSGWAHFSCIVLPNGNTANPRILSATHVDFVYPALRALEHLKYSPRTYGDTPIEAEVEGELKFDLFSRDKVGVLAANNITSPDGGAPSADLEPSMIVDPIFPYDLLLRGESGWATVSFTVNESGAPAEVRTTSASDIPFGNALIAAVEMSKFSPPVLEGRSVKVQLQRHEIFSAAGSASTAEMSSRARLLMSIRANHVTGGQRLDEDLVPL
jgi:TonB family protein